MLRLLCFKIRFIGRPKIRIRTLHKLVVLGGNCKLLACFIDQIFPIVGRTRKWLFVSIRIKKDVFILVNIVGLAIRPHVGITIN